MSVNGIVVKNLHPHWPLSDKIGEPPLQVWDSELERSAEAWAETCLWEHGPASLLSQIGQNLGAHWGRDRPPTFHVQAWYDEVKDFSYPYPQECNPYCPYRCHGPVCTHYTQLVWATSNRIGCAINVCYNMNVWGMIWAKAVYLVCNYSPPYGGGCRDNLCYKDDGTGRHYPPETEETNYIEPEEPRTPEPPRPRAYAPTPSPNEHTERNEVVSTRQMYRLAMACLFYPLLLWSRDTRVFCCDRAA
ncbi:hypothetical protein JZ751_000998 [Albula glossodonta]|uniref:SCP domain-containing protein n=1 Tax=Albula glossodonta TaxID=121402 RepID=A0A8T2PXW7_9TELE|nr:hypothetical protein JZ751_000998 [Albula glossodonta]